MPAEPLIVLDDLRVDVDGAPACDGLTFRTTGERVLVLGAPRAVYSAVSGDTRPVRGKLVVRGGQASGAEREPPLPPRWTVTEYVEWSARLSGVPRNEARDRAAAAIAKLLLRPMAQLPLAGLVPHARRAVVVASALVTPAPVVALDDPLGGLADDVADAYARILADALADRAWVVFAPRMPLLTALAQSAEEAIVASAVRVDAQGPPSAIAAATSRFVVRFGGDSAAVRNELSGRGARIDHRGAYTFVDLAPEMTTGDVIGLSAAAGLAVIELTPIARALS